MKRLLSVILCILSLVLCSTGIVSAGPAPQETGEVSLIDAVGVFSELLSAGVSAAGTQLMSGYIEAPATSPAEETGLSDLMTDEPTEIPAEETEEPAAEPVISDPAEEPAEEQTEPIPEPVLPDPADIFSEQPEETDPVPEASQTSMTASEEQSEPPQDPEAVCVSTGIEVKDFYDAFKSNVKATGRHNVSFEEKGKRSSSKVEVDDNVEIYLRYTKEKGLTMVDRITYNEEITGRNAGNIFSVMLKTLCDLLKIEFDEDEGSRIFEAVSQGRSLVYSDLLIYGNTEEDDGKTELQVLIYYTGSGYVEPTTTSYTESADNEFHSLIDDLKQSGAVPDSKGSYYFHEDYTQEWARINWFKWQPFASAKNFVISADISWQSASRTPNYAESGCGFVMRETDNSNYLYAGVRLDGKAYLGGMRKGNRLSYGSFNFGTYSYKGDARFVLVVNENKMTAYVDGARMGKQMDILVDDNGDLAFAVWSGTNKDYGIRCTFRNVFYYVW